ncbi:acyl carrier protein [Actinokineospora baliensis]|uniref:acyl carrier protein n=1 Tax=Actinokineospora baliensis TaxID=547056 RepID=UPI00195BB5A3|nr:acyl carrier protein [Actinokineospora baliensis]MBM7773495.1 acyl carrier protein [Actinokineospora baliensis]
MSAELNDVLITLIQDETGIEEVADNTVLVDLGMDSLTFSEILMNIEKDYGVDLDRVLREFAVDGAATVRHLTEAISTEFARAARTGG